MMRKGLIVALSLSASPAFAHHEVIVATTMLPMVSALVAIPLAGVTAWLTRRKK